MNNKHAYWIEAKNKPRAIEILQNHGVRDIVILSGLSLYEIQFECDPRTARELDKYFELNRIPD